MLSLISSALKGLAFLVASIFALVGLAAVGIKISELHGGSWWSKEELDALFIYGRQAWAEAKGILETLTWALAAFGLVVALGRLTTIAGLIRDFRESKGSIFELSTTISGVRNTVSSLDYQVGRLSELAPTVTSTAEKLEDALKQLADLQRIAVSEPRLDDKIEADSSSETAAEEEQLEENWQQLRSYWFANGERLDAVIERIPQARTKSRFRRMPRTDYPAIINALADEGWISNSARDLSLKLHKEFLSHRSRRRPVTVEIVGAAQARDLILAKELSQAMSPSQEPVTSHKGTTQTEAVL